MKRVVHHPQQSLLNVMEITLDLSDSATPHYNRDRDEVVFIIEGLIHILFENEPPVRLEGGTNLCWHRIPQNVIHMFSVQREPVHLIECLGGLFTPGSCVYKPDAIMRQT